MKYKVMGVLFFISVIFNTTGVQPLYAEDTSEVVVQTNGRKILFPEKEAKFRIVDDSVEEQVKLDIPEGYQKICKNITESLQKVCEEESQDGKILNMLEVTNYMEKQLGLKFSKDVVDLFNTNLIWSIEYQASKVNDDNTVDLLIVFKSNSDTFKPKAVCFNITENFVKGVLTY